MMSNEIRVHKDKIAEKLDEMADLCEFWRKNREKGRNPNGIRHALIMLSNEIIMEMQSPETKDV
jgi:hypothetical protein